MLLPVTPARTCAVVVGIERYEVGDRWNLDGPASDATRFVEWLCDQGVPPGNILVLLAPLEENRQPLSERLARQGIQPQPAGHDPLLDAFANRLPQLEGELLFLFWGGHGIITADQKRRLFCANATLTNQQVISLDDLLVQLRSKLCCRFRQQVGIIDACANYFEEMRSKVSLAESGVSHGEPDRDIKQFVLYGAATGEVALNNEVRKTGHFSEVLLDLLRQDPHWPPDMVGLASRVKAHFENQRRQGQARQTPVYFRWQLADEGEDVFGNLPVSGRVQTQVSALGLTVLQLRQLAKTVLACPGLAEPPQWQRLQEKLPSALKHRLRLPLEAGDEETELIHFFAGIWNDPDRMRAWQAALHEVEREWGARQAVMDKIECLRQINAIRQRLGNLRITTPELCQLYRRSAPDPQLAPEADDLDQVLENLWQMAPRRRGAIEPLLEFVERVARRYHRDDLSDLLTAVASPQQVADVEHYLDEEKAAAASTCEYLLLDLPGDGSPLEYWFHSWNRERDLHDTVEAGGRAEKLPATLADILDHLYPLRKGELVIELFVPLELLSCEADRWEIDCYGIPSVLGTLYPILLRWRDRALNKPRTRASEWREITRKIRERAAAGIPLAVCWVELNQRTPPELVSYIGLGNYGGYVSFLFPPIERNTPKSYALLTATLVGGAPFAFWVRETPPNWQEFKRIMETEILCADGLEAVPCRVKDLRACAHPPSHPAYTLTLLWDDPDRNPLGVPYPTTIPQRGAS